MIYLLYLTVRLLYIRVGEFRDAIRDLNIIIDKYPNYPNAYMARAQAYSSLGNNTAAVKTIIWPTSLNRKAGKKLNTNSIKVVSRTKTNKKRE